MALLSPKVENIAMNPKHTSPPTPMARLVSGAAFVAVIYGFLAMSEIGRMAGSFTKDSSHQGSQGTAIFLTLTLGPALMALFIPSRTMVMVAGLLMIPYVLVAIICLLIPPIGIALLLPPYLWYRTVMRPTLDQPIHRRPTPPDKQVHRHRGG